MSVYDEARAAFAAATGLYNRPLTEDELIGAVYHIRRVNTAKKVLREEQRKLAEYFNRRARYMKDEE